MLPCYKSELISLAQMFSVLTYFNFDHLVAFTNCPLFVFNFYLGCIYSHVVVLLQLNEHQLISQEPYSPASVILTFNTSRSLIPCSAIVIGGGGGAVAQSVERATPGQEVPGSIPAVAARSLLVGSVSV